MSAMLRGPGAIERSVTEINLDEVRRPFQNNPRHSDKPKTIGPAGQTRCRMPLVNPDIQTLKFLWRTPFLHTGCTVRQMISQTVEYALRAIVTIAQQEGEPCTAKKIAEIAQIPLPYLSKMMQGLVRGGLVRSQRGLHGGFVLEKSPEEFSILDVVNMVDPLKRIHECPLGIGSHGRNLCPLHRKLDNALQATETIFRETTLAQMLSQPGQVTPLCEAKMPVSPESDRETSKRKRNAKKQA